jgi:predicted glycoside hydrolase/deacetylase ChbG (UPF0249 family)
MKALCGMHFTFSAHSPVPSAMLLAANVAVRCSIWPRAREEHFHVNATEQMQTDSTAQYTSFVHFPVDV